MTKNSAQLKKMADPAAPGGRNSSRPARSKSVERTVWPQLPETAQKLELAFEVAASISASLDHSRIIEAGLAQLRHFIPADSWAIYLTETEQRRSELSRWDGGPQFAEKVSLVPPNSLFEQALRVGAPIYIKDVAEHGGLDNRYQRGTIRGVVCLPLIVDGHSIGVIEGILGRGRRLTLQPRQLRLAQTIANVIAVALHNATLYADVEHLCLIDDLTRLYNMRFLRQSLETELRRAKRYGSSVALIFLDLDGFKGVNDVHGHLIGSATLIETARIIHTMVRDTDFVARYGGDEFVIILPETTAEQAALIAERIRAAIERYTFGEEGVMRFRLTASFGVAAYPEHGLTSHDLISQADAAMYAAKEASKNRVVRASQYRER